MAQLLLIFCAALPIAWLVSEAQRHRWISVVLGIAALIAVGFLAYGWAAFLTTFNSNVNFSETTKSLLVAVAAGLESNDSERVQEELRRFAKNYQPSYEKSCTEEVKEFVAQLGAITTREDVESGDGDGD